MKKQGRYDKCIWGRDSNKQVTTGIFIDENATRRIRLKYVKFIRIQVK